MSTHNDIADALETVVLASDAAVRFYPEPSEKPIGDVSAELFFQDLRRIGHGANAVWTVQAIVEFSTPANLPGWGQAVRRIRALCDPSGTASVLAAVEADPTLGGEVVGTLAAPGPATGDEIKKRFSDGERWCKELRLEVTFNA